MNLRKRCHPYFREVRMSESAKEWGRSKCVVVPENWGLVSLFCNWRLTNGVVSLCSPPLSCPFRPGLNDYRKSLPDCAELPAIQNARRSRMGRNQTNLGI